MTTNQLEELVNQKTTIRAKTVPFFGKQSVEVEGQLSIYYTGKGRYFAIRGANGKPTPVLQKTIIVVN